MTAGVRLYQCKTSSASWRVRIALALKGVDYETVWIDLARGQHLESAYARVARTRQIPCLEIDGRRLVQSLAIVEYLDETRPKPPMLPPDPLGRAVVRGLTEVINSTIQPLHNRAVRDRLQQQFDAPDCALKTWASYWIERGLGDLEQALSETAGQYCFGDQITVADAFLYPQLHIAPCFDVDAAVWPTIAGVIENLQSLPAFANSHIS